jgi:hypothetical protein
MKITGLLLVFAVIGLPFCALAQDNDDNPDSQLASPEVSAPAAPPATPQEPEAADSANHDMDETAPSLALTPEELIENGENDGDDEGGKWHERKFAKLQGLNKVTARTVEIKSGIGKKTVFGNLDFTVEKCLRGPEEERFENAALITIWDEIPGQERKQVFRGWMFSSSPAISALEHPIYDVILLDCINKVEPEKIKTN